MHHTIMPTQPHPPLSRVSEAGFLRGAVRWWPIRLSRHSALLSTVASMFLCVCVGEKWGSGWMHLSTSIIMFPSSPEEYKLPLFICQMNSLSRELQSQKRFILTPDLDDGGSLPPPPPTRAKAGFICSVHSYHPQLVNIG